MRTFLLTLVAMVRMRHNRYGLLLSELGAHMISPDRAPAGTKRLSNLLRSSKWSHTLLEAFLCGVGRRWRGALAIWDESVLEKPESIAPEGSHPVRSSKAARLKRIKPGYYNPPGGLPVLEDCPYWRTARIRAGDAVAHGDSGWDGGRAHPGRHGVFFKD